MAASRFGGRGMLPIGSGGSGLMFVSAAKPELEIQPQGELDLSRRRHKTGSTKCRIDWTAHTVTKLLWSRAQERRRAIDCVDRVDILPVDQIKKLGTRLRFKLLSQAEHSLHPYICSV